MKITKQRLREIIKEELASLVEEYRGSPFRNTPGRSPEWIANLIENAPMQYLHEAIAPFVDSIEALPSEDSAARKAIADIVATLEEADSDKFAEALEIYLQPGVVEKPPRRGDRRLSILPSLNPPRRRRGYRHPWTGEY
jgi:hypothetical protein